MWPPSTPMSAAILPFFFAARTSAAVVASAISSGCFFAISRTALICFVARSTASGPVIFPDIQIEKKIASRPPSFIRGISMLPSAWRTPKSNFGSSSRCVVSSCVSTTIEEKCNFFAFSEMESAAKPITNKLPQAAIAANLRIGQYMAILPWSYSVCCLFFLNKIGRKSLPQEPAEQRLFPRSAIYFGDRFGKRNSFGAGFDAVLRVGAILDAAFLHHCVQALFCMHRARGVHIEEANLADDGRADEFTVFIYL